MLGFRRTPEVILHFTPAGQVGGAFQQLINAELVDGRRSRDG
jgi:hypothetical protein